MKKKVIEAHVFKYIYYKEGDREVVVEYDAHETTMHATHREDINSILEYGYGVDDDRLPSPENKSNSRSDTDQAVYK